MHRSAANRRGGGLLHHHGAIGLRPPWWLLAPALVLYGVVTVYPSVAGALYSFTNWNGLSARAAWVGLANFRELFQTGEPLSAFRNTIIIAAAATVVQNGFGLLLALGVHAQLRTRYVLRVLFFAPVLLSPLIVAYLFQYIFSPYGFLNSALGALGLASLQRSWLGDPHIALASVITVIVWQFVGYSMVIFLAGLESIPTEIYDAAEIDGAGSGQRLRYVTLPLLAPATTINLTLSTIGGLKIFDQVWAMTQGGPGYATETLTVYLYRQAFAFGNFGYGMAAAVALTVIVSVLTMIQVRILRSRERLA